VKRIYLTLLVLTLTLSACGNATATPTTDQIVSGIYTAGALTLEAQVQASAFTPTPLPVSTSTPTPTSILVLPTATQILILPSYAPIENHTTGSLQKSDAPYRVDYSLCNNSAYIDDVTIPDGTVLSPGETFVKTWTLENTGFCMWKADYILTFFEGDPMSGLDTEIGRAIASGRQSKISITLTAPSLEGTYTGYWLLADEYDKSFGMPFYVQIVVSN
jgi:hypothetical protein